MLEGIICYTKVGFNYTVHNICYYERGNWVNHICHWVFDNRRDMINEVTNFISAPISLKADKIVKELLFINKIENDCSQFYYN